MDPICVELKAGSWRNLAPENKLSCLKGYYLPHPQDIATVSRTNQGSLNSQPSFPSSLDHHNILMEAYIAHVLLRFVPLPLFGRTSASSALAAFGFLSTTPSSTSKRLLQYPAAAAQQEGGISILKQKDISLQERHDGSVVKPLCTTTDKQGDFPGATISATPPSTITTKPSTSLLESSVDIAGKAISQFLWDLGSVLAKVAFHEVDASLFQNNNHNDGGFLWRRRRYGLDYHHDEEETLFLEGMMWRSDDYQDEFACHAVENSCQESGDGGGGALLSHELPAVVPVNEAPMHADDEQQSIVYSLNAENIFAEQDLAASIVLDDLKREMEAVRSSQQQQQQQHRRLSVASTTSHISSNRCELDNIDLMSPCLQANEDYTAAVGEVCGSGGEEEPALLLDGVLPMEYDCNDDDGFVLV
ncbi:hypothetical protein BDR26DRAFT_850954 [Obelidium mucronatum]|nr:hypothetical protein BDR26DRAFT_850954 [Obelidium mucronatum]